MFISGLVAQAGLAVALPKPRHHVNQALLMLLIGRNARKNAGLAIRSFFGLEVLVLSSLIQNDLKWGGPNCADDVPVRGARARLVQKRHQRPGGVKNLRKAIKNGIEHGSLRRLTMS